MATLGSGTNPLVITARIMGIRASNTGYRTPHGEGSDGDIDVYPPMLEDALEIDYRVPLSPITTGVGASWGTLRLRDIDGSLTTTFEASSSDGKYIEIKMARMDWDADRRMWLDPSVFDFTTIFAGVGGAWQMRDDVLEIPLRDLGYLLEKNITVATYAGTGGLEGGGDLKGRPKPRLRGGSFDFPVSNITPILVDPAYLIYQVSNASFSIRTLYEGGDTNGLIETTATSNLYSGTCPAGQYRRGTGAHAGYFQMGSRPTRTITADVYSGAFPVAGAINDVALLAFHTLAEDMGLSNYVSSTEFQAVRNVALWSGGYWLGAEFIRGDELVGQLLNSIGAKLIPAREGYMTPFVLRALRSAVVDAAYTPAEIVSISPIALGAPLDPPPKQWKIGWDRNYTVMTTDLDPDVTAVRRSYLSGEWRTSDSPINSAVVAKYTTPSDPGIIPTILSLSQHAASYATELNELWCNQQRRLYAVELPLHLALQHALGDSIGLTWDTGMLAGGGIGQVVGVTMRGTEGTASLLVLAASGDAVTNSARAMTSIIAPTPTIALNLGVANTGSPISATPSDLGTRTAGPVSIIVSSREMTSITWVVVAPNYAFVGTPVDVATTGTVTITPNITANGQFVKIWQTTNTGVYIDTGPVTITGVSSGDNDYDFARNWMKDLTVGLNVDRVNVLYYLDDAMCEHYKACGITHIRFFPWSNATHGFMAASEIEQYLDKVQLCVDHGIKCMFDFQDVTTSGDMLNSGTAPYVLRCSQQVAARNFDPLMVAFGHTNEMNGGPENHSSFNQVSNDLLDIMREQLPGYVLMQGGSNWSAPDFIANGDLQLGSDKRRLYKWHKYDWQGDSLDAWTHWANVLDEWADANQIVVINGEFNIWHEVPDGQWYYLHDDTMDAFVRACGHHRGTMWCATNGLHYRLNRTPTDMSLTDDMVTAFQAANAYIRAQPWYGLSYGSTSPSLSISPGSPGNRAAGTWSTVVTHGAPFSWQVLNSDDSPVGSATNVTTTSPSTITPSFTTTGQRLKVWLTNTPTTIVYSTAVTITTSDLSMSPNDPGSRAAGTWTTTVTHSAGFSWVVMNSLFEWLTDPVLVTGSGSTEISPNFTATGQRLRIWLTATDTTTAMSEPVTITGGAALDYDPPTNWALTFSDDFTQPATTGVDALDPAIWAHRNFGTGAAHNSTGDWAINWDSGNSITSTGSTVRFRARKVGSAWKVDGCLAGTQSTDPSAYGYHPGFHEFHARARIRMSHYDAKGVGGYYLFWPLPHNEWSSEIDIVETPGATKSRAEATMHWDSTGNYDLGTTNDQQTSGLDLDLTQWRVYDCRRTYTVSGGITYATVRVWIDGVEVGPSAGWSNNQYLCEDMVPGFASFVAPNLSWAADWFTTPDGTTPTDSYLEVDYIQVYEPSSTTPSISINPTAPGTRAAGTWSTTVTHTGDFTWVVMDSAFAWITSPVTVTGSGSSEILPNFTATGQMLRVWLVSDTNVVALSDAVTINSGGVWAPSDIGSSLVFAADTNNTTCAADDGAGRVQFLRHLYDTNKYLSSPTSTTRPVIATASGSSGTKRVVTMGVGRYLRANSAAWITNALDGNWNATNWTIMFATQFNTSSSVDAEMIIWMGNNSPDNWVNFTRRSGAGNQRYYCADFRPTLTGGSAITGAATSSPIIDGGWHNVTLLKSGTAMTLRIDNVQVATGTIGSSSFTGYEMMINASLDVGTLTTERGGTEALSGVLVTTSALSGGTLTSAEAWVRATAGLA